MTNQQPPLGNPQQGYGPPPPPSKGSVPTWLIVLIVVGVGGIFVLGILAAIAIPALSKFQRRAKASEARIQLAKAFDGIAAHYEENGSCPSDGSARGSIGPTPPLSINCNDGNDGRCIPGSPAAGGYPLEQWAHPAWDEINFSQEQAHHFHYAYRWSNEPGLDDPERSRCQFTVQAFADLDDDGIFSTYERTGAADSNGVTAAAGLFIDQEVE